MPRARSAAPPLSDAIRRFLLTGEYGQRDASGRWFDTFQLAGEFLHHGTRDHGTPAVWLTWGEQLVRDHSATQPGTRPYAWWIVDAKAPRECRGLAPELHRPAWCWRLQRGVPFEDYRLPSGLVLSLESEPAYLRRFGLLLANERRRLSATDFEPEEIKITDDEENEEEGIP